MKTTRALAALAALTIAAAAAWAQLALKPGEYHVQLETTLPGSQPMTREDTDCLTPDDAKDIVKAMMRELASAESCTANNIRTVGNKLTFEAACDVQGSHVTSEAELTIAGDDAYTAIMKIGAAGTTMTMKITGKWVGATCTSQ